MPAASDPSCTPAHTSASWPASQASLVPVKYGSSRSPVSSLIRGSCPSSRSRWHTPALLRSCQTIARRGAVSVARSQITAVSRWLVTPTQVTAASPALPAGPAAARSVAAEQAARAACQIPSGRCSTQPGCG